MNVNIVWHEYELRFIIPTRMKMGKSGLKEEEGHKKGRELKKTTYVHVLTQDNCELHIMHIFTNKNIKKDYLQVQSLDRCFWENQN